MWMKISMNISGFNKKKDFFVQDILNNFSS